MHIKVVKVISVFLFLFLMSAVNAATSESTSSNSWVEIASYENEFSRARLEPAEFEGQKGIAVVFDGTYDLHYYARSVTTPAPAR